jgi:hypothetical protein
MTNDHELNTKLIRHLLDHIHRLADFQVRNNSKSAIAQ